MLKAFLFVLLSFHIVPFNQTLNGLLHIRNKEKRYQLVEIEKKAQIDYDGIYRKMECALTSAPCSL